MRHISDLCVDRFRGLRNLKIKEAGSVNIIVGGNNTGKTSLLEAIELLCHPLNIQQFISASRGRDRTLFFEPDSRMPFNESVEWLFPLSNELDTNNEEPSLIRDGILLTALIHEKEHQYIIDYNETRVIKETDDFEDGNSLEQMESRALEVHMQHKVNGLFDDGFTFLTTDFPRVFRGKRDSTLTSRMVTPVDHRILPLSAKSLTESFQSDKTELIHLLQLFDGDILGIELLSPDGRSAIPYFQHRYKSYIPVSVFGDGMRRVLTLASAVIRSKRGVLLIDEIETAIHPRMLTKVFSWLMNACNQYEVQLFATTHSLEAVDAVLDTFIDLDLETEEFNLDQLQQVVGYRLIQQGDESKAKRFAGEELFKLRSEYGQDVR